MTSTGRSGAGALREETPDENRMRTMNAVEPPKEKYSFLSGPRAHRAVADILPEGFTMSDTGQRQSLRAIDFRITSWDGVSRTVRATLEAGGGVSVEQMH